MTRVIIDTSKWLRGQGLEGKMIDEAGNICFLGWLLLALGLSHDTVKNYFKHEPVIKAAMDRHGKLNNLPLRAMLVAMNDVQGISDYDRMMVL